jgi:hypothetical protein
MFQSPQRSGRIGAHLRTNVIGYVALFFALTMGTAYATHPGGANTISTEDIIDGEVRSADINNGAVNTEDVTNDGVRSEDVRDDTSVGGGLAAADLGPASVGSSELAPNAVGSGAVQDGSLGGTDLANLAVGASQLADGAVTNAKLANFSVSTSKIQSDAITESKYGFASIDQNAIQTNGVAGAEIVDRSVRAEDVGTDAVGARALRSLITRTRNVTIFAGANLPSGGTASCNSDELVIGGGADWTPALHHTRLIEEGLNGNGWRVLGYYGDCPICSEDPPSVNLEIEAYCLPQ